MPEETITESEIGQPLWRLQHSEGRPACAQRFGQRMYPVELIYGAAAVNCDADGSC